MRRSTTPTPHRHAAVSRRRRSVLAAALALAAAVACERDVAITDDDPRAVEAANAGMDALLVEGPTARRVAAHRLTVERVERWFTAQAALDADAADDPARGAPDAIGAADDPVAGAVAALEARPGAEAAIRGAGLTVEEFVLTGLALHQALTASGPAAPAGIRRLAAQNARFVAEHADLLAGYGPPRPSAIAEAPPPTDSTWWYDPIADSLVYGIAPAAAAPSPPAADTLPPDSVGVDSVAAPPSPLPPIPPAPPPPAPAPVGLSPSAPLPAPPR